MSIYQEIDRNRHETINRLLSIHDGSPMFGPADDLMEDKTNLDAFMDSYGLMTDIMYQVTEAVLMEIEDKTGVANFLKVQKDIQQISGILKEIIETDPEKNYPLTIMGKNDDYQTEESPLEHVQRLAKHLNSVALPALEKSLRTEE